MEEEKYIVIESNILKGLQKQVNEKIEEGYGLFGNLIIHNIPKYDTHFYQPMVFKKTINEVMIL